ncbi:MAG: metallophosphoesterase [Planctomycetota bacterium]|nr:metallophosphoesterase [Planctomycetota bacterium]MCZ6697507.1 metallophosphoesterase [Planctomycetota bacterium]MCZ6815133.1 metallophosphoesterase [Planctomycetota bacterium]
MRIIATSDLHFNVTRSKGPTESIAKEICERGGDVLLFVGDSAGADIGTLEKVLALFEPFSGVRLAVCGNHELWTVGAQDSLHKYENELAEAYSRSGVHYLDQTPFVMDGLGIAGSVGWYDYTFRPSRLGIPLRFYQHKIAPGAAARSDKCSHLLEPSDDIPAGAHEITTRWMDGERVNLPICDLDFAAMTVDRLRRHLEEINDSVDTIVAAVHHLPFAELVPHSIIPNWEFANAFMGSELLGEVLLDFPKVRNAFCGHSHQRRVCRKQGLVCTSIGSTYREKQYEVLDL